MNILEGFKKFNYGLLDLVFPIACLICGADQKYLCEKCQANLPKLPNQLCPVCHQPAPFGKTHPGCVSKNTVDGSLSPFPYKNPQVKIIIETFKYSFIEDLAPILSGMIVETINSQGLKDYFSNFEAVPIPLHHRRFKWRGFNQAEILARPLAESLGIPLRLDFVPRTKHTQPQVKLNAIERKQNMAAV